MTDRDERKRIRDFRDLLAWQEAHVLVLLVYQETKHFPKEEVFALSSQLRRAVVSVTSNIAEGFGRQSAKEKVQFYYCAQGSLTEVKNQLIVAHDVGYINATHFNKAFEQADTAHKLLQGLIKKTKTFIPKAPQHLKS
ncbi:MAG: four helix bundle protein [bacterium]|nr:four helix bundle protein [bacterium]